MSPTPASHSVPRFVVLATQRSGSSWLIDVLGQQPGVKTYGEQLLNQTRQWDVGAMDRPRLYELRKQGDMTLSHYLDALFDQDACVGFKLMYSDVLRHPAVLWYLRRHRVPIVHLVRTNVLDLEVSARLKAVSRTPHRMAGAAVIRTPEGNAVVPEEEATLQAVQLPIDTLVQRLRRHQRKQRLMRQWLRWTRQPHLEVAYERLAEDPANWQPLWTFLGVAGAQPTVSRLQRVRRGRQADVVENYEAVCACLASTRFAPMLT